MNKKGKVFGVILMFIFLIVIFIAGVKFGYDKSTEDCNCGIWHNPIHDEWYCGIRINEYDIPEPLYDGFKQNQVIGGN